jgi:hypothetical protein
VTTLTLILKRFSQEVNVKLKGGIMSYKKEVLEMTKNLKPGLYDVEIQHDDWCKIFKGKECNCKPHIARR